MAPRLFRAPRSVIRRLAAAAAAVAALSAAASPATAAAQPPAAAGAAPPTLVVFITVDQLRGDYIQKWHPQLTGGLKRLWDGGAAYTNAHHDHATSETAPGHAATLSGRFPAGTGIVRNNAGVGDPGSPSLLTAGYGASPLRFRGTVLIDWMQARDPQARALSVSRKDRGAILPLGRAKQEAYWWIPDDGGFFSTSRYYADTLPSWVQRFNARRMVRQWAGQAWTPLLPDSAYAEPDSVRYESNGVDYTFPHVLSEDPLRAAREFANFPWMDDVIAAMALEGLETLGLGRGPHADLLAVSFSTTDAVGHRYGPDSRELHDQVLRVDRVIGAFIDSVYKLRDSSRVIFALTADHGVASIPEVRFPGTDPRRGRVDVEPVLARWRERLAARRVDTARALDFEYGMLFLDPREFERARVKVDPVLRDIARDLRMVPGMLRVDLRRDLPAKAAAGDAVARRWLHAIPEDLPVALVATQQPHHYWTDFVHWRGTTFATHGSVHDYDTHVPVILYGPPFRAGRHDAYARVVDIAPTLAHVLGVTPAERLDGVVLESAIRR